MSPAAPPGVLSLGYLEAWERRRPHFAPGSFCYWSEDVTFNGFWPQRRKGRKDRRKDFGFVPLADGIGVQASFPEVERENKIRFAAFAALRLRNSCKRPVTTSSGRAIERVVGT